MFASDLTAGEMSLLVLESHEIQEVLLDGESSI